MAKLKVDLAMRIATEHLSYRSAIAEIEVDLEQARNSDAASMGSLATLLESFLAQVRCHFALEEKGGLFEVYREHDGSFQAQARAMREQHRDFLERLMHALELIRAITRVDGPEFAQLALELGDLFRDLRQHESAEDALLERLVDQDIRREG